MNTETRATIEYEFDPTEIESHNSIDIWRFDNGRRGHIVATVPCVAPIWLPGGNDMDIEAMNEATIARANLIVDALIRAAIAAARGEA